MTTALHIFAVIIVGGGVAAWYYISHRSRKGIFEHRSDIAVDSIYKEFFQEEKLSKAAVLEIWKEVAEMLAIPPGKLRPADRFDRELAPPEGWEFDDESMDIQWAIEKRIKKAGLVVDLSEIQTLGDYIRICCRENDNPNYSGGWAKRS